MDLRFAKKKQKKKHLRFVNIFNNKIKKKKRGKF